MHQRSGSYRRSPDVYRRKMFKSHAQCVFFPKSERPGFTHVQNLQVKYEIYRFLMFTFLTLNCSAMLRRVDWCCDESETVQSDLINWFPTKILVGLYIAGNFIYYMKILQCDLNKCKGNETLLFCTVPACLLSFY